MFVSNLSYNTGETELNELFSNYGIVSSVKVITDRETGRSRGFGFVEMDNQTEAESAISSLNNKVIEGRPLSVSEARKKNENDRGNQYRNRSENSRW